MKKGNMGILASFFAFVKGNYIGDEYDPEYIRARVSYEMSEDHEEIDERVQPFFEMLNEKYGCGGFRFDDSLGLIMESRKIQIEFQDMDGYTKIVPKQIFYERFGVTETEKTLPQYLNAYYNYLSADELFLNWFPQHDFYFFNGRNWIAFNRNNTLDEPEIELPKSVVYEKKRLLFDTGWFIKFRPKAGHGFSATIGK